MKFSREISPALLPGVHKEVEKLYNTGRSKLSNAHLHPNSQHYKAISVWLQATRQVAVDLGAPDPANSDKYLRAPLTKQEY